MFILTKATLADKTVLKSLADIGAQPADPALASLSGVSWVAGDMLYFTGVDAAARLAKGTALQHLRMNSGATAPEWASYATIESLEGLSLTAGDILYATAADTLARLPKGTALQVLRQNSALTAPEWAASREVLTGNRTYYVRTDGSDSNTGLVNNAGGAFLTKQKAIDVVAALDISIYSVTIQVADGTYTGGVVVNGAWLGSGTVELVGNATTPANAVISRTSANCILVTNYGRLSVRGFKVVAATSGIGVATQYGGILSVTGLMEYGACATAHIYAERSGAIIIASNYTINGNSPCHAQALSDGYIFNVTNTITLTGTPAFSSAFAKCDRMALVEFASNTFSGAATGARYSATSGGGINTFGGGASYFPGNAAGSATAPGWYA